MLFLKLFIIFTKIGTFNFGGGYAMLSLIHNETVVKNHWLTNAEFTDIVAISQSTPGPIGINCATYVGYTACLHAGYPTWAAWAGSFLASLSIMWLPFIIMILISRYLMTHKDSKIVKDVFAGLRPAIIGLIAAAAVLLMNKGEFWIANRRSICFRCQRSIVPGCLLFHQGQKGKSDIAAFHLWNHWIVYLLNNPNTFK